MLKTIHELVASLAAIIKDRRFAFGCDEFYDSAQSVIVVGEDSLDHLEETSAVELVVAELFGREQH
jgi:tRNA C32,U32 (ribose-2'-O)-methylase TrmJ